MITIVIIIFIGALIGAFGMLTFRNWKLKKGLVVLPEDHTHPFPELSFKRLEKIVLILAKHLVMSLVLSVVKVWFITTTKIKKWLSEKWPKIHSSFKKKEPGEVITRPSFVKKALLESKAKIQRIKEKVKNDHA